MGFLTKRGDCFPDSRSFVLLSTFTKKTKRMSDFGKSVNPHVDGFGRHSRRLVFCEKDVVAGCPSAPTMSFFEMIATLWSNSLAVLLYVGKTLLPFNLSVLPVLGLNSGFRFDCFDYYRFLLDYQQNQILKLERFGYFWFIVFLAPSLVGYYQTERMVFLNIVYICHRYWV